MTFGKLSPPRHHSTFYQLGSAAGNGINENPLRVGGDLPQNSNQKDGVMYWDERCRAGVLARIFSLFCRNRNDMYQ